MISKNYNIIKLKEKDKEQVRIGTKHIKIGYVSYNRASKWKALFNYYGVQFDKE